MRKILSFTFLLLLAWGCSDLKKTEVESGLPENRRFSTGCKLEVNKFKNIFSDDSGEIPFQLDCLEKNMDIFVKFVVTDRPGYLSRVALENFVKLNLPDFEPQNLDVIRVLFKINHLLFGDSVDYISPQSIKNIIEFAKELNRQSVIIYPLFKSKEQIPSLQHDLQKNRVFRTIDSLRSSLNSIFNSNRGNRIDKLDIIEVIETFTSDTNEDDMETAKALLFIKRVFLGGEKGILTHKELQKLIFDVAQIGSIAFDLIRLKHVELNQRSTFTLIDQDLEQLQKLFFFTPGMNQILFTIDDLIKAVPEITDSFPDFSKYKDALLQVKMTVMTNKIKKWCERGDATCVEEDLTGEENITNEQFLFFFNHIRTIILNGTVFHRIYEEYKTAMDSPLSLSLNENEVLLRFLPYPKAVKDFVRIVNNYRFLRGQDEDGNPQSAYYTNAIRRNPEGIVEAMMLEYASVLVLRRYGSKAVTPDAFGGYGMVKNELRNLLGLVEDFMIDQDFLLPRRYYSTSNTITLLAALFQYQSNGDSQINANEMTEFASSILTSTEVSNYFYDELKVKCGIDQYDRISDVNCFRQNFFSLLCSKYKNYYPRMIEWLGIKSCQDYQPSAVNIDFLKTTEIAARTCVTYNDTDPTEVPLTKGDIMSIMAALLNIESTMARWDTDMDNVMDPSEVDDAWRIYKSAIEGLVKDISPSLTFLSKPIYKYLVKYEKVPDKKIKNIAHFVKFLLSLNLKANASRKTVASILKVIGETAGKPDPQDPPPYQPFNCECLRENNCTKE
jgi:hypothetical protein